MDMQELGYYLYMEQQEKEIAKREQEQENIEQEEEQENCENHTNKFF